MFRWVSDWLGFGRTTSSRGTTRETTHYSKPAYSSAVGTIGGGTAPRSPAASLSEEVSRDFIPEALETADASALAKYVHEAIHTPSGVPLLTSPEGADYLRKPEWARPHAIAVPIPSIVDAAAATFKHQPAEVKSGFIQNIVKPVILGPQGDRPIPARIENLEKLFAPDFLKHMSDTDFQDLIAVSLNRLSEEIRRPNATEQCTGLIRKVYDCVNETAASRLVAIANRQMTVANRYGTRHAETSEARMTSAGHKNETPRSIQELRSELVNLIDPHVHPENRTGRLKVLGRELDGMIAEPRRARDDGRTL